MCERVRAAVDMLQEQKRALTKGEIVMVFRKVIDDLEQQGRQMGDRMTRLEEEVASLKQNVATGFAELKALIEKRNKTFPEKIKGLCTKEALPFWFCVILIILGCFAVLGVPLTDWKGIISSVKGG